MKKNGTKQSRHHHQQAGHASFTRYTMRTQWPLRIGYLLHWIFLVLTTFMIFNRSIILRPRLSLVNIGRRCVFDVHSVNAFFILLCEHFYYSDSFFLLLSLPLSGHLSLTHLLRLCVRVRVHIANHLILLLPYDMASLKSITRRLSLAK